MKVGSFPQYVLLVLKNKEMVKKHKAWEITDDLQWLSSCCRFIIFKGQKDLNDINDLKDEKDKEIYVVLVL